MNKRKATRMRVVESAHVESVLLNCTSRTVLFNYVAMTTFNCEVKYRGCIQVTHWAPSPEAPRPGLIEVRS